MKSTGYIRSWPFTILLSYWIIFFYGPLTGCVKFSFSSWWLNWLHQRAAHDELTFGQVQSPNYSGFPTLILYSARIWSLTGLQTQFFDPPTQNRIWLDRSSISHMWSADTRAPATSNAHNITVLSQCYHLSLECSEMCSVHNIKVTTSLDYCKLESLMTLELLKNTNKEHIMVVAMTTKVHDNYITRHVSRPKDNENNLIMLRYRRTFDCIINVSESTLSWDKTIKCINHGPILYNRK